MKRILPYVGALLLAFGASELAHAQDGVYPVGHFFNHCQACPCPMVAPNPMMVMPWGGGGMGPMVQPPFPPFNGVLPAPSGNQGGGGLYNTHPYARRP
jgi:hypothetical protein